MEADEPSHTFLDIVADLRCDLVSVTEAAAQIGRSETFVRCVLANELVPRFIGTQPVFRQRDLDNWSLDHARSVRRPMT